MKRLFIAALVLAVLPGAGEPPRDRIVQACFADLQRFCPGHYGYSINACLQANYIALSNVCKNVIGPPGMLGPDPLLDRGPFRDERSPVGVFNPNGILRPSDRFGDRGVGGGIGGGEPHGTPGPFGPPRPF